MSTIIILNGTSSSGKTSIRHEFQKLTKDFYYDFSMDNLYGLFPAKYVNFKDKPLTKYHKLGIYFDAKTKTTKKGEYGIKFMNDMPYVIKTLADRDTNIIGDLVLTELERIKTLVKPIRDHQTYLVRTVCSIENLRIREKQRGDRKIGLAENQLPRIDTKYNDLVLESNNKTPKQLAKELISFIKNNKPQALKKLQ